MSHITETEFQEEYVWPYVESEHPNATIEEQKYVEDPSGYVDLWVDVGSHALAIEVGNNDATIREECAQAIEYASHDTLAVPCVIVPEGHGDTDAIRLWQDRVLIIQLPTDQ